MNTYILKCDGLSISSVTGIVAR